MHITTHFSPNIAYFPYPWCVHIWNQIVWYHEKTFFIIPKMVINYLLNDIIIDCTPNNSLKDVHLLPGGLHCKMVAPKLLSQQGGRMKWRSILYTGQQ